MIRTSVLFALLALTAGNIHSEYVNFEVSHVHPIGLTPSGSRLLAVNTPDALVEQFAVLRDGSLLHEASIPVGLEPVTVRIRNDDEAWVVNHLSDTVSIVDLSLGTTVETLHVGDGPTDVVFALGKAFVAVSQEDAVKVFDLSDLDLAPITVDLFGRDVRALAVSNDGQSIYAVVLKSGNQTTIVKSSVIFGNNPNLDPARLSALGLRDMACTGQPPPYPPLPSGIPRNPALVDPPDGIPKVGLIVQWDDASGQWMDEAGQDWSPCLPYQLGDHDLFIINAASLAVSTVDHLGTTLFDVSVKPDDGRVYVPNTNARNFIRFEHPLGVQGHPVDNQMSIVDPGNGNAVTILDLNTHIDRGSDPATNLSERLASISEPAMLVWKSDGTVGYLVAIGSRKVFKVDGTCLSGNCIFGPNRSFPDAVEAGEGPTGVALLERENPASERLYVLNRISHSIAIVDTGTLTKIDEVMLHDPSSEATRAGRRFLYDAIDGSGHGDAACSSCHTSGNMDGLAWDLGDPTGDLVPYSTPNDNVRFVSPTTVGPVPCTIGCTTHVGFDPQKGPMATQTLRGMLEPLHWRGDRPTMNDFNMAFVSLLGTADIGPINGKPAGLTAEDMEQFRQFALAIRFPSNPYRNLDDTLPNHEVRVHGSLFPGNPGNGEVIFTTFFADAILDFPNTCTSCHAGPFGAGGGTLGGVAPQEPTSLDAAPLLAGVLAGSLHSDLKIPHLRNLHEKFGPVWAAPGETTTPETKTGFGFTHDGAVPDLFRFLSNADFVLSAANQAQQVRDVAAFLSHFPTGTKPSVGRQVTLPAGTPPTGSPGDEVLLSTLISLGDLTDPNRHSELVATTISGGRLRSYHLSGGAWVTDVADEPAVTTLDLRQDAQASLTFTAATLGSGMRLGGNRDEDVLLNGDDCAPADPATWAEPVQVSAVMVEDQPPTLLSWEEQATAIGPSVRYEVLAGDLSSLHSVGLGATSCLAEDLENPAYEDARTPSPGDGFYYLVRAENPCATGGLGPGREALDLLDCMGP